MTQYRFGSVAYTLAEIEEIGRRHGEDLIHYYPPSNWGPQTKWIAAAQDAYHRGYAHGLAHSYRGDQSHLLPK